MNDDDSPSVIDELAEDLGFGDYLGEYEDDDESSSYNHDQLPDVESYRQQMGNENRPPTLTKSICVAMCSFILVTAIIVTLVSVILNSGQAEPASVVFEDDVNNGGGNTGNWYQGETERFLAIREYVTTVRGISTFDSVQALGDAQSPQYKAAQWMAHGDLQKMEVPQFDQPSLEFDERYAMAVFYFATGGPSWSAQLNFLSSGHICTWNELVEDIDGFAELRYGVTECPPATTGPSYPRALIISKFDNRQNAAVR